MSSLYKRATPSQRRILRAVEGAVKNVADVHPDWTIHPCLGRSVAKRAAGTLTAQWPDVLAARRSASSIKPEGANLVAPRQPTAQVPKRRIGSVSAGLRRSPLRSLEKDLARQMRGIKDAGNTERAEAFIYVLKMIAKLKAMEAL